MMDYEDSDASFGNDVVSQNEALANIINPPDTKKAEENAARNAVIESLKKQILGQGLTDKWKGEGLGSADANARHMAEIMADTGITDIKQFGPITKTIPGYSYETEQGTVDVPEQTVSTFGNKETGKEVANTYSERQTGNFFGGTFAGKGNTGYGVQFDAQGNPIFYTQGASSNDLVNLFKDDPLLGAIAQVGAAYFGGPAGSAALAAAMGKSPEDILKSTALSYLGNAAGSAVSGMEGITDVLGKTGTEIASNAAKQFVGSGGNIDPVQALLSSGLNAGINTVATDLGMGDLTPAQQKMVSSGISGLIAGQTPEQIAMNVAMAAATAKPGSSPTSSFDSGNDQPLSPEEQAQLIENRLNTAIGRSQISPEEEEANTQRAIDELESLYGPSSDTRSLAGEPQKEEADDFLKSIGINTIDKPSDSGLSNQDILNLINADNEVLVTSNRDTVGKGISEDIFKNLEDAGEPLLPTPAEKLPELVMTGDRDTVGKGVSEDIFRNLEDAGEPILPTPAEKLSELVIKGDRPKEETTVQQKPANLEEFLKSLEPYIAPAEKLEELVIKSERPMPSPDEDFMPTPIANEEKLPEPEVPVTPIPPVATPKVPTPTKAPTIRAPTAPAASSGMDMMGLLALLGGQQQPTQQAPMQDPYADIKLMEDLFGSTIDLTPAGENTARRK